MRTKPQVIDTNTLSELLAIHMPAVLRQIAAWDMWLKPAVHDAIEQALAGDALPIEAADALDDIGNFACRLGEEIMRDRERRGLPLPAGPDDD